MDIVFVFVWLRVRSYPRSMVPSMRRRSLKCVSGEVDGKNRGPVWCVRCCLHLRTLLCLLWSCRGCSLKADNVFSVSTTPRYGRHRPLLPSSAIWFSSYVSRVGRSTMLCPSRLYRCNHFYCIATLSLPSAALTRQYRTLNFTAIADTLYQSQVNMLRLLNGSLSIT